MSQRLEDEMRGAQEFIEYLEQREDEDGKINLRRDGNSLIAGCFNVSVQDVEDVLAEEEEGERWALEQGNPTGSDTPPERSTKTTASTKTAMKKVGVTKKAPAGPKGSATNVQDDVESTEKTAKESDWTRQYDQGIDVLDGRMSGIGCGRYTFGTKDDLHFSSPYAGMMRIEISDGFSPGGPVGSDGSGGSIRMSGPELWYGTIGKIGGVEHGSPLQFLIAFRHIVRTIHTKATKQQPSQPTHKVIIIPTGAAGASSIKRELPQVIEFEMPVRAKDEGLAGKIGAAEQPDAGNETYLAASVTACNKQLKLFDKQVVEVDVDKPGKTT
ncbi:hypothetical protein LTR56_026857 [Elasticomyces elasticus]|nr:hypothetical protein LTR56_026857 [Elasticomyces elasticus]KAK3637885.1 hypothetical protein LTR22_018023 [Elasticomyces elasticus]KAK4908654.1 hypothetical protein LTR49_022466 [Elasticomyces elasticus]KAK5762774.1 hypothetical protein LTS12_007163 [Elasticomyces elasticus]